MSLEKRPALVFSRPDATCIEDEEEIEGEAKTELREFLWVLRRALLMIVSYIDQRYPQRRRSK